MTTLDDDTIDPSTLDSPPRVSDAALSPSSSDLAVRPRKRPRTVRSENWDRCSERWGCLMIAAQAGEDQAYEQLLRELDVWLRRYYARRLPSASAEDARQDALLAIHAKRHTYAPSRAFGAWVMAIARYKWIDRIRDASRFAALPLDDETPIEDHGAAAISAAAVNVLLGRLKPAQASVIRLVKLKGLSIAGASGATGQSAALVKINIHRGLKKLTALVSGDVIAAPTSGNTSETRYLSQSKNRSIRRLRNPATQE
jgi:RNA polymerase sigma factor (sigma-70 family)